VIESLWRDIRLAVRSLRSAPIFALAAIATLALGIGANAAMFSIADATALRPPDVPEPGELVRVFSNTKDTPYGELPYPDYVDFRTGAKSLSGVLAYESADFALAKNRQSSALYLGGWIVSANFFDVLGVDLALGRGFHPEEETIPSPVAVISHRLWEREFGRDASIVGREILLSGASFTIVGVAAQSFNGTELYFHPEIFVPLSATRLVYPTTPPTILDDRANKFLTVLGRLEQGANAPEASVEVAALADRLARAFPETNRERTAVVLPELTARARLDQGGVEGALVIMGLVGLVLLLACANVANLVLSRNASRMRDVALRAAMGATRAQLIRQLLAESVTLSIAGGAAGLIVGGWVIAYLSQILVIPSALPLWVDFRLDSRVMAFTGLATVLTAILVGLFPALQTSRLHLNAVLKQRPDPLPGRVSLRSALVVLQVAISVLVLVAAGLMVRAAHAAQQVDPGFRREGVLTASLNPTLVRYDTTRAQAFYRSLVERVRDLPGVASVGLARFVPLGVSPSSITLSVDGARTPDGQNRVSVAETIVDPGYWDVMRTPIVRGRAFDDRDTLSGPRVAIVNETLARQYWPDQDPLGKTVRIPDVPDPDGRETLVLEIVGVARDGKYWQLGETARPFIYRPVAQTRTITLTLVVLAHGDPEAIAAPVMTAIADVDANVPLFDVRTLESYYQSRALVPSRLMARIVTTLGFLGLLLASIGLYGVIAFLFARRTHEIGIRMAVGASRRHVLGMVFRQAAVFIVPGLALGLGLAVLLTPLLGAPAFDFVAPADPLVMSLAAGTMAIVAFAAASAPAIRASRINPTTALRTQ
jgi:predicted permease